MSFSVYCGVVLGPIPFASSDVIFRAFLTINFLNDRHWFHLKGNERERNATTGSDLNRGCCWILVSILTHKTRGRPMVSYSRHLSYHCFADKNQFDISFPFFLQNMYFSLWNLSVTVEFSGWGTSEGESYSSCGEIPAHFIQSHQLFLALLQCCRYPSNQVI